VGSDPVTLLLAGIYLFRCPRCQTGTMIVVADLPRTKSFPMKKTQLLLRLFNSQLRRNYRPVRRFSSFNRPDVWEATLWERNPGG
jgi:hypothetical protein